MSVQKLTFGCTGIINEEGYALSLLNKILHGNSVRNFVKIRIFQKLLKQNRWKRAKKLVKDGEESHAALKDV